ncbi:MAG TPA: glycosyltransferase family 1 protein [Candidatus Kapabacteria bacterium]|jgi:glycosyltransferase involved in cell wall biosynthesis|nr:glycosyltransferase family 1 protein [Candidatus Kapabacteria bacterium]
MNIGIAALGRVSEDTGGKNYILHFLSELSNQTARHHFTLFLSSGEQAKLGIERSHWLRIIEIPNSNATPLHKVIAEQLRLPGYIRHEKIDVMYYPGNFISLFSRVPSVVNIRAVAHCYGKQYGIRGVRRIIRSLLMPSGARKAKAIVTPSEDIKQDVVRFMRVSEAKIHVIPHGVDVSIFDGEKNRADPESLDVLNTFGLRSGEYLLYVSALWRYKNQDKLIRAHAELLRSHPELKLVLAGKGTGTDSNYLQEIHSLPQQLGAADRVVFTGALGQHQLRYLYAHARAFVFPSAYESFGNPIFEAWASGIPLATSNVHSFPEIVQDAGLLFSLEDISEMTSTIEQLLSDRALCAELIARGHDRARKFTWESCVRRTLSLVEGVIP